MSSLVKVSVKLASNQNQPLTAGAFGHQEVQMIKVEKRDGQIVNYDLARITNAIQKASSEVGRVHAMDVTSAASIVDDTVQAHPEKVWKIVEIQRAVEDALMTCGLHDVARVYIQYRHQRDIARDKKSDMFRNIEGLLMQKDKSLLHENANKDSKIIPTQRDLLAGIISKELALKHILPADVAQAHKEGVIHYHDLDYAPAFPMFNCMLIDLKGMLERGFKMGNAEIESPKSISTAAAVTAQIIAQVASHIYGGNSIDRIDEVLAPYVALSYKKHLQVAHEWSIPAAEEYAMSRTEKEVYDAMQSLEYEINTLHTANGQTPFTTFGFGMGLSWESRLIQKSILQNRICGIGAKGTTAVFPKLVFGLKDGVNRQPTDPNYDIKKLALECATKRMYPDILNYEMLVKNTGAYKAPMGCRSFLGTWKDANGEEVYAGRNNLGVISLNLPMVALDAGGDVDQFFKVLQDRLELCHKALQTRIARLEKVQAKVAPILYCEGALGVRLKPDDYVADVFKNGRASISLGYIGLHETVMALTGKAPIDDTQSLSLAIEIMSRLRAATDQWKEESGYAYSLYGTPSENLCDRFLRLTVQKYGKVAGVTDKEYFTNSFHLDVNHFATPFAKIDFEAPFAYISNGGFIDYVEFPNMVKNPDGLEAVWDYTADKVPYFGTNTPIDECYKCGYKGEFTASTEGYRCPSCGNNEEGTVSVIRRVCGYLSAPDARPFNFGKQAEVGRRVKHMKSFDSQPV